MGNGLDDLRAALHRIDGRGYKAYRDVRGRWERPDLVLCIDRVQGDPFAAPSKLRLRVPQEAAELPARLFSNPVRRTALADFLTRRAARAVRGGQRRGSGKSGLVEVDAGGQRRGSGKSGLVEVDAGGQQVLERTACVITDAWVELRVQAGLPAAGRRVLGREAEELLCDELPELAAAALCWERLPQEEAARFVDCIENQEHLRSQLDGRGLVAFVADGALLPRQSGASDRPLAPDEAVLFEAPEALRVELSLLHPVEGPNGPRDRLRGLGVPRGVTLVVGGGYHGKSTLLRALESAVYPHVPGDGREWVVSAPGLAKIRAEDGRRVEQVDISAFVSDLPQGRSTARFSSDDASGSTSQAANIVEAIEAGATGLLLDEDTSATNFMVRDARMQALVAKEHEPITPFLERVREIHDHLGISTVLVMGGCGDYFEVADTVIAMRAFRPEDATREARAIADASPSERRNEALVPFEAVTQRVPEASSFDPSRGRRDVKIAAKARDLVLFGTDAIDLRCVEQLVDLSQTRAVGHAVHLAATRFVDGEATLREVVDRLEAFFDAQGLDALDPHHRDEHHPGDFARPRGLEIAAAINRLRTLRMRQKPRQATEKHEARDDGVPAK
ncbi:MAG: ATPase [Deltaproteobacteria bacterium]|nr:ATPase [Deltaproteobacteria bacterium]MDP6244147.1 ABC-ATPase domain-containing protein [Myxococcota bacterium]